MDKSLPSIIRKIEENTRNINNGLDINVHINYKAKPSLPKGYKLYERDVIVFGHDADTNTSYGYDKKNIYKTTDEWQTKQSIFQLPEGEEFRMRAYGVRAELLSNGRILIASVTNPRLSNYGYLYISNEDKTEFTKVLDMPGGIPTLSWGFKEFGNMLFVGEYGQRGRKAWMSVDGGLTWKNIYDRSLDSINEEQQYHIHDIGYDPYRGIVWLAFGDGDNRKLMYSHNFGKEWFDLYEGYPPIDPIGILATPEYTIFGNDLSQTGIDVLPHSDLTKTKFLTPDGMTRRWSNSLDENTISLVSNAKEIDGVYYFATLFSAPRDIAHVLCSSNGWDWYEMVKISLESNSVPAGIMNLYDDGKGNLRAAVKTEYEGGFKELIVKKPTFKNI